ncbi:MAG: DsbA family protein [Actinomycetota bacterium]|nr:DsbA family protein [Actinomycetota bacterium]MDQ5807233.1 DsbA family protein [Actinomycetota bacterium]
MAGSSTAEPARDPAFYLDLSSPEAWLSAERILALTPVPCEWIPVAVPFTGGFRCAEDEEIFRMEIERRAPQPVRWPPDFPFDATLALRAATYAKAGGKTVAFCLAAFRQAYAGGRSLADEQNVMIAAAACEIHPRALLKALETRSIAQRLDEETAAARERGVVSTPAFYDGERIVHGDEALEPFSAALA